MATGRGRAARRLKPWLVEQIESGKFPGLMWDDDQKTAFRIPWKHAGKQDFRHDEDAAIFKAWAQYKNKFQNGDKLDAATWKTRLRCALNKSPEFKEFPERSQLDVSEPYKVYKIVPPEEQVTTPSGKVAQKRKSTAKSCDDIDHEQKKPIVKLELSSIETAEATSCGSADSGNGSDTSITDTQTLTRHNLKCGPSPPAFQNTTLMTAPSGKVTQKRKSTAKSCDDIDHEQKKPILVKLELSCIETAKATSCGSSDSGNGSDTSITDTQTLTQHNLKCGPSLLAFQNTTLTLPQPQWTPANLTQPQWTLANLTQPQWSPANLTQNALKVTVLYSGVEVSHSVVQSGECKLSAKAPTHCFSGKMEHVLLPLPTEPLDEKTQKKTGDLLKFLEAGVMLASNANGIFAQRQKSCSGRIYWTGPLTNSQGTINKLERDKHVKLFDTQNFLNALELYKTNGGVPPDYHVTLCFGEELSDSDPTEDKLITAKIEQVMASELVNQITESLPAQDQEPAPGESSPVFLLQLMPVDTSDSTFA